MTRIHNFSIANHSGKEGRRAGETTTTFSISTKFIDDERDERLLAVSSACGVQWLNCPATGGGSLSLKLLDYTFVRLGEKFRTSIKHSIPPCTRKVCFVHSWSTL